MPSWPARLLAVVISSGLALCVVELVVRARTPQPLSVQTNTPLLRGKLTKPGEHHLKTAEYETLVHVNQQGFVDNEWPARRKDVPRIVVIGDSFVQAAQVNLSDGFGRVLAQKLSSHMGKEVEVLSLGVPGAGTATALGLLEEYAFTLEPDAIVLGFLVANDVMNNHPLLDQKSDKPFFRLVDGQLSRSNSEDYRSQRWQDTPLWGHSHAWRWAIRQFQERQEVKRQLAAGQGIPVPLRIHDPDGDPIWEDAWQVTDALLAAMATRCADAAVPFGVLLFPDAIQATAAGHQKMQTQWPSTAHWDIHAAGTRAEKMAVQHGPVLNLRSVVAARDTPQSPPTYFAEDGHWTAVGHDAAASGAVNLVLELLEAP